MVVRGCHRPTSSFLVPPRRGKPDGRFGELSSGSGRPPRASHPGRLFDDFGDLLVGSFRREGEVTCSFLGLLHDRGERPVDRSSIAFRCPAVDRRGEKWVAETNRSVVQVKDSCRHCGLEAQFRWVLIERRRKNATGRRGHGCGVQRHLSTFVWQRVDPVADQLVQAVRNREFAGLPGLTRLTTTLQGASQLERVERVTSA
jgi:hypothetical protein